MADYILGYKEWLKKQKDNPERLPKNVIQDFVNKLAKESDYLLDGYIHSANERSFDWVIDSGEIKKRLLTLQSDNPDAPYYPVRICWFDYTRHEHWLDTQPNNAIELWDAIDKLLKTDEMRDTLLELMRMQEAG